MEEIWKPVIGYEEIYEVSNLGRIRRIKRGHGSKPGCILKGSVDLDGYSQVGLSINSKQKWFRTHRIVAQAFIPNPDNKPQVNHIDGNKLNNFVGNLEWVSSQENIQHAWRTGLSKMTEEARKKNSESNKGRPKSEEHRKKISESLKGKIVITNEVVSIFIFPEDFPEWESKGYRRGYKKKYQHLKGK